MSVNLYDGTNHDGLFDLWGKAWKCQGVVNTARGTTIPTAYNAVLTQFEKLSPTQALSSCITGLPSGLSSLQGGCSALPSALSTYVNSLGLAMFNADSNLPSQTTTAMLAALIAQMQGSSDSVNAASVTVAVTAGTNTGNGVLVASKKRGDGLIQQNVYGETITAQVTNAGNPATASIGLTGQSKATSLLDQTWPLGSGASATLTAIDAASNSLLTNGGFETQVNQANVPDNWILSVGIAGTDCKMTVNAVQQVVISGTPTGGWYPLRYTNAAGKVQTVILNYNAAQSDVQSALRTISDLSQITVVTTGTGPNYTHTITFTGLGGNITNLASAVTNLTGGTPSISISTTTTGTAQVFKGNSAVEFLPDGSTLTTLNQRLTGLSPQVPYAVNLWATISATASAGVITIDLVDGIGGSVINDSQGVANSVTFNASSLTTGWKDLWTLVGGECVFRLPAAVPPLVYLRIRQSTAVTSGKNIFFDSCALGQMTQAYQGGPYVAAFSGNTDWAVGDSWSIAVTTDRGGVVQEWMNRNFDMASKGLLLPYSGSPTIPDSVAA